MIRHLVAPDRPVPCCESWQGRASRVICPLNQMIFHHNLLVPDSIRGSLQDTSVHLILASTRTKVAITSLKIPQTTCHFRRFSPRSRCPYVRICSNRTNRGCPARACVHRATCWQSVCQYWFLAIEMSYHAAFAEHRHINANRMV